MTGRVSKMFHTWDTKNHYKQLFRLLWIPFIRSLYVFWIIPDIWSCCYESDLVVSGTINRKGCDYALVVNFQASTLLSRFLGVHIDVAAFDLVLCTCFKQLEMWSGILNFR